MVDRIGHHNVIADFGGQLLRQQRQALGLIELCGLRPTVAVAFLTSSPGTGDRLQIIGQFHNAVMAGVGYQESARGVVVGTQSPVHRHSFAGEAQGPRDRLGCDIGSVTAMQCALRLMFSRELLHQ